MTMLKFVLVASAAAVAFPAACAIEMSAPRADASRSNFALNHGVVRHTGPATPPDNKFPDEHEFPGKPTEVAAEGVGVVFGETRPGDGAVEEEEVPMKEPAEKPPVAPRVTGRPPPGAPVTDFAGGPDEPPAGFPSGPQVEEGAPVEPPVEPHVEPPVEPHVEPPTKGAPGGFGKPPVSDKCKGPYLAGELCAGEEGKEEVEYCGCADVDGVKYYCTGPPGVEGYGNTCAPFVEGKEYQVGERCMGEPGKPLADATESPDNIVATGAATETATDEEEDLTEERDTEPDEGPESQPRESEAEGGLTPPEKEEGLVSVGPPEDLPEDFADEEDEIADDGGELPFGEEDVPLDEPALPETPVRAAVRILLAKKEDYALRVADYLQSL